MFSLERSFIKSKALFILIPFGGFSFSFLVGNLVIKASNSIVFALIFLGIIFFAYLIYKDIFMGIGIFIGSMLFEYDIIPLFSHGTSISKIIGILILGLCILSVLMKRKSLIPDDQKSILIVLFFLWSLFSLLFASNTELGIYRITTLFQLICTYILLIKIIDNSKALTKILLTVTILGILISVTSIVSLINSPEILTQTANSVERFEGTGTDPNHFAQNFLVLIPFGLFFYLWKSKKYIWSILAFIFVLLSTFSRGGFVGLLVVLFLSTIVIFQTRKNRLVFTILIFSALVASIIFLNKNRAVERRLTMQGSTRARLELIDVAMEMGISNFATGVGLGNFIEHSHEYCNSIHYRRESHNGFLEVFATLGFPGFLIFSSIIYLCIKDFLLGIKKVNTTNKKEVKALLQFIFISFISFLITGFFLGLIFAKMFWILVAFSSISKQIAESETINSDSVL
ncbi:MAG: O-antigen ligase family protein [Candidatus Hodarchaeota archaeon]